MAKKTGFNRILTLLRKERGITQKEAAQGLGISQALLSHYEVGKRECKLEFLVRAAAFYEVPCDYLLGLAPDRSGMTIQVEDIPEADGRDDKKFKGSVLPVLSKKLISNSVSILFGLLQETGEKRLTSEMSDYLMLSVYKMFRMLFSANSGNPQSAFAVPQAVYSRYADAEMARIEANVEAMLAGEVIGEMQPVKDAGRPEMSAQQLGEKFPLLAVSLFNLIQLAEKTIQKEDSRA